MMRTYRYGVALLSCLMKPLWAVVPLAFIAVLGCQQAMSPDPAPKPEPPKPTLIGTWQFVSPEHDDDGMLERTETLTLTFTSAGRFIEFYVVRRLDGSIEDRWRETGTWTATQGTVTKTLYEWDDENDRRFEEPTTINKHYTWGDDSGEVLFIHPWGATIDEHYFVRGIRVEDPIPYPLTGTWTGFRYWDVDQRPWTFTFGDTFTEHYDDGEETFTLTGEWRLDEENLYFFVTVENASDTRGGVAAEDFDATRFVEHELRYAFAPTGLDNTILLSPFGIERSYDVVTSMWVDREDSATSNRYWMLLERQP